MMGESEGGGLDSVGGGETEAEGGMVGMAMLELDVGTCAVAGAGVAEAGVWGAGVDLTEGALDDCPAMKLTMFR